MKLFERLEEALEKHGPSGYATGLRFIEFICTIPLIYPTMHARELKWMDEREIIFIQGFALLQREIYHREQIETLEKKGKIEKLTDKEEKQITEWKRGWQERDKTFWLFKRYLDLSTLKRPNTPRIRDLAMRGKDKYYYSEKQKKLCAAMGGCCGRKCGCCQKLLKGPHGLSLRAHCTMECGCCIRSRGFRSCGWRRQEAPATEQFMAKVTVSKAMEVTYCADARAISTEVC